MKIGMLWHDNSKNSMDKKIQAASEYYAKKYGRSPTLAFISPKDAAPTLAQVGTCTVRTSKQVAPNHIWIGVNDE